ncbi:MAG: Ig-like domain-containing protein [Aureliella sp.]
MRKGLVETLERRELLAGDLVPYSDGLYYPETALHTAVLRDVTPAEFMRRHEATSSGSSSSGGTASGEDATSGAATTVSELEPNDSFSRAQLIPLGAVDGKFPIVNVVGQITSPSVPGFGQTFDEDWYAADLKAGDIIDVRLDGQPGINALPYEVTLMDSSRTEIAGRNTPEDGAVYPPVSPLASGGSVSFSHIIPADGRYYLRVLDGDSTYTMQAKVFRPTLEKEAVGTKQKVFVDFDGARVRLDKFGLPTGTARLSSLTSFFAGAGLQDSDEEPFIRSFLQRLEEDFQGSLPQSGNNGYFSETGIAGQFDIEFINSFDHPDFDPTAHEHVTQLIIGGSATEVPLPVFGISDSVDVGNFDTAGTVLVLPDPFLSPTIAGAANPSWIGSIPVAAGTPLLEAYAAAMANVASHELGHSFGAWHVEGSNANISIMDNVGPTDTGILGVGADGVFGTDDDIDIDFNADTYALAEGNIGTSDTAAIMAFGLSTGKAGGSVVMGNVFNDANLSRSFDAGEGAGPSSRVFADVNNNGVLDSGEFFAVPNAAGQYTLSLPAGAYNLSVESALGWRLTTASVVGVNLGVNDTATVNFGFESLDTSITGVKWNDANADGLRDAGETGLAGIWIYIDEDGDNRIDIGEPATQTDENGAYSLNFPGPGTYTIREVIEPGFQQTFPGPAFDNEHTITLTGDPAIDADRVAGLNFGNTLTVDFGDAPESYGAAAHGLVTGLRLGLEWDPEAANQPSINALGDDQNGTVVSDGKDGTTVTDDEDGVAQLRAFRPGANAVSVTAQNSTGTDAFLNAWFDFNHDGDFLDDGEHVIQGRLLDAGTETVTFTAPTDLVTGTTFARFRYSNDAVVGPTGIVSSGEVEDYAFDFTAGTGGGDDFGVADTATVARNSTGNVIDVLANDLSLPGESLTLVSNSSSTAGATIAIVDNAIVYTPPAGFIGVDTFTYTVQNSLGETNTVNVTVNVQLSFADPVAIDDSFDLPTNSIDFPLNVLANDIEGQNGALTIVSITQPNGGGSVSIATGGKSLRYTPLRDFGDTEVFTYTAQDAAGNRTTANVTLHTLGGAHELDDVLIQLVARDLDGNLISAVPQGERFVIDVVVDDLRGVAEQGASAGVFAAFADILYDLQLVSTIPTQPGERLNFEVDFFNNYTNGTRGDASIPGLINDFGAFLAGTELNEPNPVKLASIEFEARSPGIANFMPDPADSVPATDTLLFNVVPQEPVPISFITYQGTMIEIVSDGSQFPVAVDDSVPVAFAAGSIDNPIDVLSNDIAGSAGTITISSFQSPTDQGGRVTLNAAGSGLLYTPRSDFQGTDQFTYEIEDTRGIRSTATVTVRVGDADADDIVRLNLRATDANGNEIDEIVVGQTFQLRGFVQDLRTTGPNLGIFAAYEDVLYDSGLVSVNASTTNDPNLGFEVAFGPDYGRVREGNIRTAGVINEIGAVSTGDTPLGTDERLVFTVNLTANAVGLAQFIADPADISPLHDVLTYEPVEPVPFDKITFGFDSLNIVASSGGAGGEGWHNARNGLDVNNDGFVSPIDALGVINFMNSGGTGPLGGGGGEGETGSRMFVDTNDDGHLSPIDALLVINHLNSSGSAEGEAAFNSVASLLAGGVAESAEGVAGDFDAALSSENLADEDDQEIGSRMTNHVYGPSPLVSSSGNQDVDEKDDIFGQLGNDLDGNPFI